MQGIIEKMVQMNDHFDCTMSKSSSGYMKLSFGSPNSESERQSHGSRKITRQAGLDLDTDGRWAALLDTERPGLVSNGHQTWSRASKLTQEPMGSLVLHIGSHGARVKLGQCDLIQHKPRTEEAKLQMWPNFIHMHIGDTWPWQGG
jgi:hypothetical protein